MWRIDLQLGTDANVEEEQRPERVVPRLKKMLGERTFELEWVSIYRFNCRRLEHFVHGRVVFVGDSAHQVSPFGARGGKFRRAGCGESGLEVCGRLERTGEYRVAR